MLKTSKNIYRKVARKIFYVLLAAFLVLILSGIFITRYYGEEIKKYSIERVNEKLETKLAVESIGFSFFSNFPYLSVVFTDVMAQSGKDFNNREFPFSGHTDTLFSAKKIYLQFNIFEILIGNYNIRRILASEGKLNLLVDSQGRVNYQIFNKSEGSRSKSPKKKEIELEGVKLEDFSLRFTNLAKNLSISAQIHDILLKARISSGLYDISTMASVHLIDVTRDSVNYSQESDLTLRTVVNVSDSTAFIRKGELTYNGVKMDIAGNFGLRPRSEVDVNMNGRNFDLRSLFLSLPRFTREKLPFEINGKGDVAVKIKGIFSRKEVPSINARYALSVDRLKYKNRVFQNIEAEGSFSNGRLQNPFSTRINIDRYTLHDYQSELTGSLTLQNLKEPSLRLVVKGRFEAAMLREFIATGKMSDFGGSLRPDLTIQARIKSFHDFNIEQILSSGLSGSLEFDDFSFKLNDKTEISGINGNTRFAGDTWFPDFEIQSPKGIARASLQLDNVLAYFSEKKGGLWVSGSASLEYLDLSEYFKPNNDLNHSTYAENKPALSLPGRLFIKMDVDIDHLVAGKFSSENIKTYLQYKPGYISFSPFRMETMEGKVNGHGSISQDKNKEWTINSQSDTYGFNISHLFKTFNNFQQSFIVDRNLKGFLFGKVNLSITLDSLFNARWEKLSCDADIVIRSGELIDFEPIKKLSRYIELEELEHIYFSTLENNFSIKNKQVIIPGMAIKSSAFNIGVSGIHNFDNHFEYKLKVSLSELLAGKAGSKKENMEFGTIEPDTRRTNLFLSIAGTPDDFKIKYDPKEAVYKIKQDLKEEKANLKSILHEEFGWFKKDSSNTNVPKYGEEKFRVEWEEEEQNPSSQKRLKKRNAPVKENENIKFEWDDDEK